MTLQGTATPLFFTAVTAELHVFTVLEFHPSQPYMSMKAVPHGYSTGKLICRLNTQCCTATEVSHLVVDLQVGGTHKELALCSVPIVLNIHEDIFNGPGDDAPAGPTVSPLHCEGLAGACLTICNNSCIVALHANVALLPYLTNCWQLTVIVMGSVHFHMSRHAIQCNVMQQEGIASHTACLHITAKT